MVDWRLSSGILAVVLAGVSCSSASMDALNTSGGSSNSSGGALTAGGGASGASQSPGGGAPGAAGSSVYQAGSSSTSGGATTAGGAATVGGAGGASGGNASAGAAVGGTTATAGAGSSGAAGAAAGSVGAVPLDATLLSRCTGTSPVLCTIPVPNDGNYTVTVELGSASAATKSRVQAELYRIVIPELSLAAGSYSQQTFSVNVRAEKHGGYSAPGKVLDLRIDGASPALHGLGFVAAPNIPTIFVAGDSTVCDWDPVYTAATPATAGVLERGWAQELSQYLKPGIAVANYADSGETAGSFYTGFWPPAKAALRAGDYVFVQFGHNDQKGDLTLFTPAMMRYITDARAAKATPVLFTPPGRKSASAGNPGFAGLDGQTRTLAQAQTVQLVDLTALSIAYYGMAPDKNAIFANPTESTHFSETGATALSNLVVTALKASTSPLKDFIR